MRCSRHGNGANACDTELRTVVRKWIVLSTYGRKWQLMEDVKGMWYTE